MSSGLYSPNYYPNSIFSVFSFTGFLVCIVPFPWNLEAWNTGMCLWMIWTGFGCLILFINSIIWRHNVVNWAPVWCDIAVRYYVGQNTAVASTCLAINRRLYHIAAIRIPASKVDNRRVIVVDTAIALGLPVIGMILQYIPQGHRFNIIEDVGCWPTTWTTTVGYAFYMFPPIVISLVSTLYAFLGFRCFWKSRKEFGDILAGMGHKNLTLSRYVRLVCLASLGPLITIPVASYMLALTIHYSGVIPWTGWYATHVDFQRVDVIPASLWKTHSNYFVPIEASRWSTVGSAFLFFAFFSFAEDAVKKYRSALQTVSTTIGLSHGSRDLFASAQSTTPPSRCDSPATAEIATPRLPSLAFTRPKPVNDLLPVGNPSDSEIASPIELELPAASPNESSTSIQVLERAATRDSMV